MCNCNDEMESKIKDKILESLEPHSEFDCNWDGKVFRFDGKNGDVMLKLNYEYRGIKTNGEPKKNMTKSYVNISMKFCPFCGVEYNPTTKDKIA